MHRSATARQTWTIYSTFFTQSTVGCILCTVLLPHARPGLFTQRSSRSCAGQEPPDEVCIFNPDITDQESRLQPDQACPAIYRCPGRHPPAKAGTPGWHIRDLLRRSPCHLSPVTCHLLTPAPLPRYPQTPRPLSPPHPRRDRAQPVNRRVHSMHRSATARQTWTIYSTFFTQLCWSGANRRVHSMHRSATARQTWTIYSTFFTQLCWSGVNRRVHSMHRSATARQTWTIYSTFFTQLCWSGANRRVHSMHRSATARQTWTIYSTFFTQLCWSGAA
jgi:hypothetical protein